MSLCSPRAARNRIKAMKYYSTNHQAPEASLQEAVVKGLASDKGLYMPEVIKALPQSFYDHIENLSFQEMEQELIKIINKGENDDEKAA